MKLSNAQVVKRFLTMERTLREDSSRKNESLLLEQHTHYSREIFLMDSNRKIESSLYVSFSDKSYPTDPDVERVHSRT